MRFSLCGAVLILVLSPAAIRAQNGAVPPLDRIIELDLKVGLPVHHCTVPTVLRVIGRLTKVPTGVEFLPGDCQRERTRQGRAAESVDLLGMTVEEALNTLVELDGRYRWVESHGLIVMRPLDAWGDSRHFLHRTMPSLVLVDQHLGGALSAIVSAIVGVHRTGMGDMPMRTEEGDRRCSLDVSSTPIANALDAIVRVHGALSWEVEYREAPAIQDNAIVGFWTFDGSGLRAVRLKRVAEQIQN
jgi:hypothetical protein